MTDAQGVTKDAGRREACWGLLRRQECWRLSPKARLITLLAVVSGLVFVFFGVHPFLAENARVGGDYLVIEGWIPDYALEEGLREFREHPYRGVLTVGCQMTEGIDIDPGDNYAEAAAKRLERLGLDPVKVQAVPSDEVSRNRTYLSAVALRDWFEKQAIPVKAIDVVTLGTHARRSRLLVDKAFHGTIAVGVIAVVDREYDPSRWWESSEGVREVIGESIAYLYARLLFHPSS